MTDIKDKMIAFADAHPDTELGKLAREIVEEHNQAEWEKQRAARGKRGPQAPRRRKQRR